MARKSSNTSNTSNTFTEASVWGNMSLVTKSGEVKHFKRGIPLDTSAGVLEQLLAQLPHGTELNVILKVTHVGQNDELTLDDLI